MKYVDLNGRFPWIVIPLIIGITVGLTGCGKEEEKTPPEDYRQEDSTDHNCYSYAFQLPVGANPGQYSFYIGDGEGFVNEIDRLYTPKEVTNYILSDMKVLGKNVRVIESPEEAEENEYVVAMKTSTYYIPGTQHADYHFAVLLSDGTWADKVSGNPSRWNMIDGMAANWDAPVYEKYYNTESVYFAVERCLE